MMRQRVVRSILLVCAVMAALLLAPVSANQLAQPPRPTLTPTPLPTETPVPTETPLPTATALAPTAAPAPPTESVPTATATVVETPAATVEATNVPTAVAPATSPPAATAAPTPSQAPVTSLPNTGGSSSTPLLWVGLGLGLFLVGVAQLRRSRRAQA